MVLCLGWGLQWVEGVARGKQRKKATCYGLQASCYKLHAACTVIWAISFVSISMIVYFQAQDPPPPAGYGGEELGGSEREGVTYCGGGGCVRAENLNRKLDKSCKRNVRLRGLKHGEVDSIVGAEEKKGFIYVPRLFYYFLI